MRRLPIDPFTQALLLTLALATLLPCRDGWAIAFDHVTDAAIAESPQPNRKKTRTGTA